MCDQLQSVQMAKVTTKGDKSGQISTKGNKNGKISTKGNKNE